MLKNLLLALFITICIIRPGMATPRGGLRTAFHIGSPTGLSTKVRLKAEVRLDSVHSLLLCGALFWGYYPGYQVGLEYRRYLPQHRRGETYIYGEGGTGNSVAVFNTHPYPEDDFTGPIYYGGVGLGRHINMGNFFFDFNGGIRITAVSNYPTGWDREAYSVTGPGAILRLNFSFGLQFPAIRPKWNY
jgi:hypothetical protein